MRAVVVGGSVAGSAAALALARRGAEVVVVEADATPLPSDPRSPDLWTRPGTPHGRLAHAFLSLFITSLEQVAPDVLGDITGSGAVVRGPEELVPPSMNGSHSTHDDRQLMVISSRRSLVEVAMRDAVLRQPGVEVRVGHPVVGLRSESLDGIPHVTGVVVSGGEVISSDVVLVAAGRRLDVSPWLAEIGAMPGIRLRESANTLYFTRHYRIKDPGQLPRLNNGFVSVNPFPWFSVLMFPGDNDIAQVAMGALPEDTPMKAVRRPETFHAVALMATAVAPWVDPDVSEPVGDVGAMGNVDNYLHRLVRDGSPVATGLHLIGDSVCLTNPQHGRGVSHAVGHARHVAEVVLGMPDDPKGQTLAIDREVERMLSASYWDSVRLDRSRTGTWREGAGLPQVPFVPAREYPFTRQQALLASQRDPVVLRAMMRGSLLVEPPGRWLTEPEVVERILQVEPEKEEAALGTGGALPSRAEVLQAIAAS